MEDLKIKISALWVARMLTGFLGDVLRFMEPGMLEQIISGETGGMQLTDELLTISAIIMILPIIMVYLSLTLENKLNRLLNILVALFIILFDFVGLFTYNYIYSMLLIFVGLIFCAVIIWHAWKLPLEAKN